MNVHVRPTATPQITHGRKNTVWKNDAPLIFLKIALPKNIANGICATKDPTTIRILFPNACLNVLSLKRLR